MRVEEIEDEEMIKGRGWTDRAERVGERAPGIIRNRSKRVEMMRERRT